MTVRVEEAGHADRPAVVLVHGSMDRAAGMLRLSRQLERRFRVVRYDRRGFGRSVHVEGPYAMGEHVADLLQVVSGREVIVIGHSYGGNVALSAAAQHPDLVRGVAIYEMPMSWEPWWPGTTAGSIALTAGSHEGAGEMFMRRIIGDERWEALPEKTRARRRAEGPAMVGELDDLRRNRPWLPEQITVPLVVAFGSLARAHHRRAGQEIAAAIADAQLVVLDGSRHDAPSSHPELFVTNIVDPLVAMVGEPWAGVPRATANG